MKVKINTIEQSEEVTESAILNVYKVTEPIEHAIHLLRQTNDYIFAKEIETEKKTKISLINIVYIEYLERNIFLYEEDHMFQFKGSLIKFKEQLPINFIQISKNTLVNIYKINSFKGKVDGSLSIDLHTKEKLVVSRRYVSPLKKALIQLTTLHDM